MKIKTAMNPKILLISLAIMIIEVMIIVSCLSSCTAVIIPPAKVVGVNELVDDDCKYSLAYMKKKRVKIAYIVAPCNEYIYGDSLNYVSEIQVIRHIAEDKE